VTKKELHDHALKCGRCEPGLSAAPTLYCPEITEALAQRIGNLQKELVYEKSVTERMLDARRDEFAKAALTGWIASFGPDAGLPSKQEDMDEMTATMYRVADSMMRTREVKP
jgi:hypothetical protein